MSKEKVEKKEEKKFNWLDVYGSKKPKGENMTDKETILRWKLNQKKTLREVKEES